MFEDLHDAFYLTSLVLLGLLIIGCFSYGYVGVLNLDDTQTAVGLAGCLGGAVALGLVATRNENRRL